MKKAISSLLILSILFSFASFVKAEEKTSISIGDYLEMGTYYGKPILWRCVDIDENGPLMLSDRILCLKAFDGKGTNTSGSHGRGYYESGQQGYNRRQYGSNYWADSNIRDWLNSSASAGNVVWSCGNAPTSSNMWNGYNAYDQEAGFLTNFTESERSAMKTVTQKSLLDGYEHADSSNTRNSNYHEYDYNISSVVLNYATAYSEQVTDTMFLLDVKQINEVYNNRSTLGNDYYIGTPTAEAVANSEYKTSSLNSTTKWWSWLRSPYANSDCSTYVRGVYSDGDVYDFYAYFEDGGVRPAFYLNLTSVNLNGSGSVEAPYLVKENPNVEITGADSYKTETLGGLRFITSVESSTDSEIEYYGTWFLPNTLYLEGLTDLQAEVKTDGNLTGNQYTADLLNIPSDYYDTEFIGISFVKFKGLKNLVLGTKVTSVNDSYKGE